MVEEELAKKQQKKPTTQSSSGLLLQRTLAFLALQTDPAEAALLLVALAWEEPSLHWHGM